MVGIELGTVADTPDVMQFMHTVWRNGHILSYDRELLWYDFREGQRLNFALARDESGRLVGLFGFMRYSDQAVPDLAGSLWKVDPRIREPMLGLRLREFALRSLPHRFFAAPGAGPQTRPIYQAINMQWVRMDHFVLMNPTLHRYRIATIGPDPLPAPAWLAAPPVADSEFAIHPVTAAEDLQAFPFNPDCRIAPFKDQGYVTKRFFHHPIYRYDVHLVRRHGKPENLIVAREVRHGSAAAYRVVDYYGAETNWTALVAYLGRLAVRRRYEYVDFLCYGFDREALTRAGFVRIDPEQENRIVPNHFEPFQRKNVPVYAVADRSDTLQLRLCKADGDQDRPNAPVGRPRLQPATPEPVAAPAGSVHPGSAA